MKKKVLGALLFVVGIILLGSSQSGMTGAVISDRVGAVSSIIGLVLIVGGIVVMQSGKSLEKRLKLKMPFFGWKEADRQIRSHDDTPIVLDTNYLIKATKDPKKFSNLKKNIEIAYDQGYPLIVPPGIQNEFGNTTKNRPKQEMIRLKELQNLILDKTTNFDGVVGDWNKKRDKYEEYAKRVLKHTSKAQVYRFCQDLLSKGIPGSDIVNHFDDDTIKKYFGNERIHEKFIEDLEKVEKKIYGGSSLDYALKNYAPSDEDAEILGGSIYLSKIGRGYGDELRKKLSIMTDDSDIEQAVVDIMGKYPLKSSSFPKRMSKNISIWGRFDYR